MSRFAPLSILLIPNPANKVNDHRIVIVPSDGDHLNVTYTNEGLKHVWRCSRSYLIGYIRNTISLSKLDQDDKSRCVSIQFNIPSMPEILCLLNDKSRIDEALRILEDHLCFLLADIDNNWPTSGWTINSL
jgi:hypothetical protein